MEGMVNPLPTALGHNYIEFGTVSSAERSMAMLTDDTIQFAPMIDFLDSIALIAFKRRLARAIGQTKTLCVRCDTLM